MNSYLNAKGYEGGFNEAQIEQIFTNIESNFETWASYFASTIVDEKDSTSVEKFRKSLSIMRPEVALSLAKTIFHDDLRDCLDKVQTPCVIVQTTNYIVVPNSICILHVEDGQGEDNGGVHRRQRAFHTTHSE